MTVNSVRLDQLNQQRLVSFPYLILQVQTTPIQLGSIVSIYRTMTS